MSDGQPGVNQVGSDGPEVGFIGSTCGPITGTYRKGGGMARRSFRFRGRRTDPAHPVLESCPSTPISANASVTPIEPRSRSAPTQFDLPLPESPGSLDDRSGMV